MTTPPPPRRRELTWPRLDPADRPDPAELAEQRRRANPRAGRRTPRPATTEKEQQP